MTHTIDGIIVERTPMRELARRLIDLLQDARIQAWVASRAGVELARGGDYVAATAWDVTVPEPSADRARRVIAEARRGRRIVTHGLGRLCRPSSAGGALA
jgi:hypothetical protein